eukprot:jgi/Chrzof1/230/Cz01g08030.t1
MHHRLSLPRCCSSHRDTANTDRQPDRLAQARDIINTAATSHGRAGADQSALSLQRNREHSEDTSASDDDYSQALSRALRLINYAERSKSELQKRLTEDTYPSDTIRKVLQRLQELGLQSDARYAELYVKGKWRTSKHSPQRLTYDLSRQGISKDIIATALECTFGSRQGLGTPWHQQDDTDDNQEDAWSELIEAAQRHANTSAGQPVDKRRAKMARWLQYRGHDWATVKRVLKELGL